jgi:bile acid:Na+ symporter, BASS family
MLMMLGMGLQLGKEDWLRVVQFPKAVWVGLLGQFVLLPAVALGLAYFLSMPLAIAAGLLIVAVCPGGVTSNSVSFLARADIALSITLTAISSLLALVTVPLFLSWGLDLLQQDVAGVDTVTLPVGNTIKQLLIMVFIPIVAGMTLRHFFPGFAKRSDPWVRAGGVFILLFLLAGAIALEFDFFVSNFFKLWPVLFTLNIVTLIGGYFLARGLKLSEWQSRTIGIEVGIQNVALGAMLALTILKQPEWVVVPSTYSVVMSITAFVVIGFFEYRRKVSTR